MRKKIEASIRQGLKRTGVMNILEKAGLRAEVGFAWDYLTNPQARDNRAEIESDHQAFAKDFGFMKEVGQVRDENRTIFFVSLTDWVTEIKIESILGKALAMQGCRIVVITQTNCRHVLKYYRSVGITDFIYFDKEIRRIPTKIIQKESEIILKKETFKEVLESEFQGVQIGRRILSSVVKNLRRPSVDFKDPDIQEFIKFLTPDALRAVIASQRIVAQWKPRAAFFLEKGYSPNGVVFDVCIQNGVDAIHWGHAHRRDRYVLKRYIDSNRFQHHFSFSKQSWKRILKEPFSQKEESEIMSQLETGYQKGIWFDRKFLHADKKVKSRDEVVAQLGLDPNKKTAVIFSHVLWDATFFYGENLFDDYRQWLVETVRAAMQNDQVNWIVKVHPDYLWKMKQLGDDSEPSDIIALREDLGNLPSSIKVILPGTDISTYSIFKIADYCITVRGTVGIEMPCFGVPTLTAGTGRYSGLGFTVDSTTKVEYLDKIRQIHQLPQMSPEQTSRARRHAYFLFLKRPFEFTSFEMTQSKFENQGGILDHNVNIGLHSRKDLEEAQDLKAFSSWVLDSSDEDYMQ